MLLKPNLLSDISVTSPKSMIEVGRIINDNTKWNCDWIPFILLNSGSKVTAIQYYYKEDMMNIESSVMKEKLQEIGKLTGGISVIPIIPDELIKDKYLYKGTSKNYVLRNPISQKTRKSLHDNGIKVNYQIFQSASTDFLISKQERMQIPFKNSPIEIYNDTCCMSNSLN